MGRIGQVAWNKGLTKETDIRLEQYGKKGSLTKKSQNLTSWNKGKHMSNETKTKLSNSMKLLYSDPEFYNKIVEIANKPEVRKAKSKALKGLKRSEVAIKNISESQKGKILSEEHKLKIKKSTKIATNTQKFHEKRSKLSKEMWSNPVFKDRQIKIIKEVHNRPDVIKHHAFAYSHRPHKNTDIEIILENMLKSLNIIYESQKYTPFGVPDFFIQPNICLFADGNYDHTRPNKIEKDKKQTQNLENIGYVVFRFWGSDLKKHPEKILDELRKIK
jgi:very-short-patch-repair endonuclease